MIVDVSDQALDEVRTGRQTSTLPLAAALRARSRSSTPAHEAALRRVGAGLVLGPWSNILTYGPKFWPKREHRALVQLIDRGDLRVVRVSGSDMRTGHAPSVVPPWSEFYYEIVPARASSARDRRRRRVRRRREP